MERIAKEEGAAQERAALRHVHDRILNLACPRCGQVFVDFTDCFALSCSRCNAAFCAYCLEDCGDDAHAHVMRCEHNPTNPKDLFASGEVFEQAQRRRRARMLEQYLRTLAADMRARLMVSLQPELRDLGVELAD